MIAAATSIPRRTRNVPDAVALRAPASFAQRRLWFLSRFDPGSPSYNMPMVMRVAPVDPAVLERALNEVVRRHEALRTTFADDQGTPHQVVHASMHIPVRFADLRKNPDGSAEASRLLHEESLAPFDLEQGPLVRCLVVRLTGDADEFALTMHHIISDGWSMAILSRELWTLYEAFAAGLPSPLPEPALQYADYSHWQHEMLQGERLSSELAFWTGRLRGAPASLELPYDRPRPPVQVFRGSTQIFGIAGETADALRALARRERCTLFMVLLAAFAVVLRRYSGQDDIVIGTPTAGRTHADLENLIGFFVNTLALRLDLSGNPTFLELLRRVRDVTLDAYTHQDMPFDRLVEELQPARTLSHNPIFQVMLILQNTPHLGAIPQDVSAPTGEGSVTPAGGTGTAKFDLVLSFAEAVNGLYGAIEFNTDLFDADRMSRLAAHLQVLLAAFGSDPGQRVLQAPLLSRREQEQLRGFAAGPLTPVPGEATVHRLFSRLASERGDAVGAIFPEGEWTYAQLDRASNQLARRLRTLGVRSGSIVPVAIPRSPSLLVALLGILKSGGAYLPLDVTYPTERLQLMIADSGARLLLTVSATRGRMAEPGLDLLVIDDEAARLREEDDAPLDDDVDPADAAYVMYTSGSLGRPKASMICHRSIVLLLTDPNFARIEPRHRVAQATNVSFDPATFEIWGALLNGATLVHVGLDPAMAPKQIADTLRDSRADILFVATAVFHYLAREYPSAFATFEYLGFGGEPVDPDAIRAVLRHGPPQRMVNMYGLTECTVFSTFQPLDHAALAERFVPIGRPVSNTACRILDERMQLVPVGVPGELYIGGELLGREYFRMPELTASSFVPDPYSERSGARLYRTGDRATWLRDGRIAYNGRIGRQVKVRGHRIEPEEIEQVLRRHSGVDDAVVLARAFEGDRALDAYVIPRDKSLAAGELRSYLAARLPAPMIPSSWVLLDAFPLNANGKVDRRVLASIAAAPAVEEDAYVEPRTETEEAIAQIWCGILGVSRAGVFDNFFSLGGHSLLATRVIARINSAFGVEVPLRKLFETPTIAALAGNVEALRQTHSAGTMPELAPVPRDRPLPVSFGQERLWFLDQFESGSRAYNVPLVVRLGRVDVAVISRAVNEIVRRHEALRTTFAAVEGQPLQIIAPPSTRGIPLVDLTPLPLEQRMEEAWRISYAEATEPFDLARGPLFRRKLVKVDDDDLFLFVTMHHILCDGWSTGLFMNELRTLVAAYAAGEASPLPDLQIQYADFAHWQRRLLQGEVLERQLAYWRQQLHGAPSMTAFPPDRPRPAVQTFRGSSQSFTIPLSGVTEFSRARGVTLFMTLLSAFSVVAARLTGEDDLVVGTPVANRTRSELEPLIGFFVNTLALRMDVSGNPTFAELLERVREVTVAAYTHQDLPYEKLVNELQPERNLSHQPVFQMMFVLQNADEGMGAAARPDAASAGQVLAPVVTNSSKFDLTFSLALLSDALMVGVEYSTDLYDHVRIPRIVSAFANVLSAAVAAPDQRIRALPLLAPEERRQLVFDVNATARSYDLNTLLHQHIEQQAMRTPDAVAITFEAESLTYAQLNDRANRLAWWLRDRGVRPDDVVAVCIERSLDLLPALLAILKAGGAYLPLDPSYPRNRLRLMIEDAAPRVILAQEKFLAVLPEDADAVAIESLAASLAEARGDAPPALNTPDDLAYVIFTSGSTGRPKAAMNTHRAICNRLLWMQEAYALGAGDRVLQKTSTSFDVSVWELFWPLMTGASIVFARPGAQGDSRYLIDTIVRSGITAMHFVPSMLRLFLDAPDVERCTSLRLVVCSGEALTPDLQAKFFARLPTRLENLYGPTEAAVDVTCWPCPPGDESPSVPIGWPIANTQIHILDDELEPVPVGAAGSLYIGGVAVGRGYLRAPRLTADRFIPDPFSGVPGARLYRTGDNATRRVDGAILYLGRGDGQEKLRGFRIETGEIESILSRHPAVAATAVIVRDYGPADRRLIAYVVPAESTAYTVRQVSGLERASLIAPGQLYELPNGMVILPKNAAETDFLFDEIFTSDQYGTDIDLPDDAVVIDAGANIGMFTLWIAERSPGAHVFAFEPIPELAELLARNISLYPIDARVYACGLSDQEREVEFTYYAGASILSGYYGDEAQDRDVIRTFERNRADASALNDHDLDDVLAARVSGAKVLCRLRRLSSVIREAGIERIDLLKIDVEKSEHDVLRGIDDEHWPMIGQVVVEVHDIGGRLRLLSDAMAARGFEVSARTETLLDGTGIHTLLCRRPDRRSSAVEAPARVSREWYSPAALASELRRHAAAEMPDYMVPSRIVFLDELPLTGSGKTDRRALPAIDDTAGMRKRVAPRNETEETVAAIWGDVLRTPVVGVEDDFFELGGHSLLASQVVSRIHDRFGLDLPLRNMFEKPTVAALATTIAELRAAAPAKAMPPVSSPHIPVRAPDEAALLEHIDELSDDEVQALLDQYTSGEQAS